MGLGVGLGLGLGLVLPAHMTFINLAPEIACAVSLTW